MKRLLQILAVTMDRKWLTLLILSSAFSLLLVVVITVSLSASSQNVYSLFSVTPLQDPNDLFIESTLVRSKLRPSLPLAAPPRLAYVISGSKGDGERIRRTLQALYHPRNQYVLHLDREAPVKDRMELIRYVKTEPTFTKMGNVHVIAKANLVTYMGPTMVATTLQAASILLRKSKDWDWFINLSSSDYPLVTQDDLLHVLSDVPRDLNFLDHTSDLSWKEYVWLSCGDTLCHPKLESSLNIFLMGQRARPIIIDPGLYMSKKSSVFWVTQGRSVPTAFKLFTGSAWVVLSRAFVEYCIWGWENLPRIMLMYYTNFVSSAEGYFHTIICNTKEFSNTTVNHDMHYLKWDDPPKQHPLLLSVSHFQEMHSSGAPFARKFAQDDPVLDMIDNELLGRRKGRFTPGGWCAGKGTDPCSLVGDPSFLKPGPGARRLKQLISKLLSEEYFRGYQCK